MYVMDESTKDKQGKIKEDMGNVTDGNDEEDGKLPGWAGFAAAIVLVSVLYVVLKDRCFEGFPKVTDLIIDQIVIEGSNKTGEWELFWRLLWIGCFAVFGVFWAGKKFFSAASFQNISESGRINTRKSYDKENVDKRNDESSRSVGSRVLPGLLCFVPAVVQCVFYGSASVFLWLFAIVFFLLIVLKGQEAGRFICLFLFLYFDMQTLAVVVAMGTDDRHVSDLLLFVSAVILFLLLYLASRWSKWLEKYALLLSQLPLPLLLLLYTKNTYEYQGEILRLDYPKTYLLFIFLCILGLYAILFIQYRKREAGKDFLSVSSAISVFLYGSYIPAGLFVQSDLHHHGEQILPWQQIVNLGNTAYDGYSPVSGLFPMLIGGVNDFLFGGKATTYAAAFTVLFLLFGAVTIFLISLHVDGKWTLLFAFLFHMPVYCRTWIILPVLLLLMLPSVIRQKRRFLYLYVFCGFLSGLYYPLFGLALIVAVLPFACMQFYSYCKEKTWRTDVKTKSFYAETLLLLIPIILAVPLLYRMASHILSYSHQTLLADGLSLQSVSVPDWFMPYLSESAQSGFPHGEGLRSGLYYAIRFLGGMLPVWLFLALLLSFLQKYKRKKMSESPAFLGLSAGFLILPVCYTYTMVIMDESWVSRLFSRSSHIYLWILGILLPILLIRYGAQFLEKKTHILILTALSLSVPFICFYQMRDYQFPVLDGTTNQTSACVGEYAANLEPFPVMADKTSVSEDDLAAFPNLGCGFIENHVLEQLYAYKDCLTVLHQADEDLKILGLDSGQMYYFLLNESALYSGKVSLAKSRETADAVISLIDAHTVIGSDLKPLNNYYIYRYLLENGYAYDQATGFYLPRELYTSIYGVAAYEASSLADSPWASPVYLGKCPVTLGHNLSNLEEILTPESEPSEFLYVEIDTDALSKILGCPLSEETIMTISWEGKSCMLTDLGDGKLLLPLATNADWAVSPYPQVYISLYDETQPAMEIRTKAELGQVSNCLQYYSVSSVSDSYVSDSSDSVLNHSTSEQ